MKYLKLLLIIILGLSLTFGTAFASISKVNPVPRESLPIFIFPALNKVVEWGQSVWNWLIHPRQFGSIAHVQTTDTVGTLRTTVNTIIDSIQNTTSSLGLLASLASTTGNLIVGSSTQWRAMIVGTNGKVLTASSTAVGGLSWESLGAGVTSLNGLTGAITANIFNTTTTLSGSTYISVTNGGIGATTVNLNITPVSSTRAINAGSNLLGGGDLSADRTLYWNTNPATSTIATATSTNLSVTSTLYFGDGTKKTTNYKSSGFTMLNSTTTASSSMMAQRLFYQAFTLAQLDCSSDGPTITISAFIRASSTPATNGTTTFANIACSSTGFSTTTFTNANFGANQYLAFASSSVSDATSTLVVSFKYQEQ